MLKKISIALLAVAAFLIVAVISYDPLDEETALFRQGAPTEKVLEARETGSAPANPLGWVWGPALVCAGLGLVGLRISRKKS